jgi:Uncharacterized protein conserved in bacteria
MKLIYAIVHSDDGRRVMDELNNKGFSVTKLCSTGGFLKSGNTTLITGVEEDKVDEVISIIEKKSKSRKELVNPSMPNNGVGQIMLSYPIEVTVGGATIFVVNVERFEKV